MTVHELIERLGRSCNRAYARLFGYFWIPCPICGRRFGGHEWGATLWTAGEGRAVCRNEGCVRVAEASHDGSGTD